MWLAGVVSCGIANSNPTLWPLGLEQELELRLCAALSGAEIPSMSVRNDVGTSASLSPPLVQKQETPTVGLHAAESVHRALFLITRYKEFSAPWIQLLRRAFKGSTDKPCQRITVAANRTWVVRR